MNFRKLKISGYCFALILMTGLWAGCEPNSENATERVTSGDSWEQVQQQGGGTVNILYVPSGGFAYEDENGHLTGTTIEIFRAFRDWVEENHEVTLELNFESESEWQEFYQRVAASGDGVMGTGNVTITEERRDEVQFSPPYLDNIAVLISHEDRPELDAMEDIPEVFADQTGLMYPGTLHGVRMEELRDAYYPDMPLDTVRSNDDIMNKMEEGDRYFTYVDVYNFVNALYDGIPVKRQEIGDDDDEQFGFILPLNSDWIEPITEFFEYDGGFVQSETYREIVSEHLGEDMTEILVD